MITEKTVEELAVTCRFRLTEEERARFAEELSALMELASPLLSVDREASAVAERATGLADLREDVPFAENDRSARLLSAVKQMHEGCPSVPRAVEE